MKLLVYFDGAAFPNAKDVGGVRGIGVVLKEPDGTVVQEISEKLPGIGTNNTAEYTALIRGLEEAKARGADEVVIRGDSQLIIRQIRGDYRVREPRLRPLHDKAVELCNSFDSADPQWIPREQNTEADKLSYDAIATEMRQATGAPEPKKEALGSTPSAREHDVLCPKCRQPCRLTLEKGRDGSERIRQACPEHGFVCWAPMVEPFLTLARGSR